MFADGPNVDVKGTKSVLMSISGDLTVNTTIDVSAQAISSSGKQFHLGGFALASTNCCYVGAGPGAGFTFHGGGHGGVGGGSWTDTFSTVSYGKSYEALEHLVGGSSGAFIYDSNPGSGGGAIAFNATGVLTIGSKGRILANGFNVKNTSHPACSGGSAGGRIKLDAAKVVVDGELSARGGNSGISSNYSDYCGDGGGGGVIDVTGLDVLFSKSSAVHYSGGRGLENGSMGQFRSTTNLSGVIEIDTKKCEMEGLNVMYKKTGSLSNESVEIDCDQWNFSICTFTFNSTVSFGPSAAFTIKGEYALKIVVKQGDIIVATKFDMSAKDKSIGNIKTFLGGYRNSNNGNPGPGSKMNWAGHGSINDSSSYGIWPVLLMGGSSCSNESLAIANGGGALELVAKNGNIIVDANISADAYTSATSSRCGASGGTIILDANNVTLNAFITANGCDGDINGGHGGIVQASADRSKIMVNPGRGQGMNKGKFGTVLERTNNGPAINPRDRSCKIVSSSITTTIPTDVLGTSTFKSMDRTSHQSVESFMASLNSKPIGFTASETIGLTTSKTMGLPTSETMSLTVSEKQTMISSSLPKSYFLDGLATPSSAHQVMQSSVVTGKKDAVSEPFKKFVGAKVNSSSAVNMSSDLAKALQSSPSLTRQDAGVCLNVIRQLSDKSVYVPANVKEAETVSKNLIRSCSKLAQLTYNSGMEQRRAKDFVPNIALSLENFGESVSTILKTNETFFVQDDIIVMEVTKVDKNSPRDQYVPVSKVAIENEDNVTIPRDLFASIPGNVSVIFVLIATNSTYNQSTLIDGEKVQTVSNIISVRLSDGSAVNFKRPIVLRSKLRRELPDGHLVRGGFWKAKSTQSSQEGWSFAGCSSERKGGYIETKSDHMTSFAVLLSVTKERVPDHHKVALSLITYIGCGISLFGLLMTFAAYVTLDNLDPERAAIHTNLVVALGIAQIIFLAGINATSNKPACTTVAVLLHYFFSAAFSWMFAEGIHLYKKVVSVFSHGNKTKFYYVIGWGLPVIIVALSAGIRPDGYGTDTACWISIEAGLIWAFVAPVTTVIIINFIILIMVVKILISSVSAVQVDSKTSQETNKTVQQTKAGAKAMIILMPILGLSWVFGILAVNEATIVFQYLFCIFNSLQGFFIFIVYVIGNSEVRSAFKRLQERHSLSRSVGERSFGLKSIVKKSKADSAGEEILVRRETGSSFGSPDGERMVTPKTLSAGQISLNSLNCPTPIEDTS